MSAPKHTPEPGCVTESPLTGRAEVWDSHPQPLQIVGCPGKRGEANAHRIVACVNSCEGINPEAVPDLLAACEAVLREHADDYDLQNVLFGGTVDAIRAAIAKAKGEQ